MGLFVIITDNLLYSLFLILFFLEEGSGMKRLPLIRGSLFMMQ